MPAHFLAKPAQLGKRTLWNLVPYLSILPVIEERFFGFAVTIPVGEQGFMDAKAGVRTILFRSGSESLTVTPIGANTFRLEDSPICRSHPRLGDVIEVEALPDGNLKFMRIVRPSGLKQKQYLLSRETVESEAFKRFLQKIDEIGGYAERVFGGLLILSIPKALSFEQVESELDPHPASGSTAQVIRAVELPSPAPAAALNKEYALTAVPPQMSDRGKMTDGQKISLGLIAMFVVLVVAAVIRLHFYPPRPSPTVGEIMQESYRKLTPECRHILTEDDARLGREESAEDADTRVYLREFERIENSSLPLMEKEIALRRLTEKADIEGTTREADADIAFTRTTQKLKDAGCLTK